MIKLSDIQVFLQQVPSVKRFCIAYSGGLDSQVLLHAFNQACLEAQRPLIAIHVHHGLSPNADRWAEFCQQQCQALDIEFHCLKVNAKATAKQSPEAAARVARYAAFKEVLQAGDCLVTAHHQNDQAETLLLQLLRGAGPKGLASMPELCSFADAYHWRPLLNESRQTLAEYAEKEALSWCDDESNFDTSYARNFLRHSILPLLQQQWPSCVATLSRSARHCAQANDIIEAVANDDLLSVQVAKQLDLTKLCLLPLNRQDNVIRLWLERLNLPLPSAVKLNVIHRDVIASRSDATPIVDWQGAEVRRYQNLLYAMPPQDETSSDQINWLELQKPVLLPNGREMLCAEPGEAGVCFPSGSQVSVRFRQGGETFSHRQHSRPLKKYLQEWGIPPWERDQIPLIYCDEELVCVVGYAISQQYYSETSAWQFSKIARARFKSSSVSTESD